MTCIRSLPTHVILKFGVVLGCMTSRHSHWGLGRTSQPRAMPSLEALQFNVLG